MMDNHAGPAGNDGMPGRNYDPGPMGCNGIVGPVGPQGTPGMNGTDGEQRPVVHQD